MRADAHGNCSKYSSRDKPCFSSCRRCHPYTTAHPPPNNIKNSAQNKQRSFKVTMVKCNLGDFTCQDGTWLFRQLSREHGKAECKSGIFSFPTDGRKLYLNIRTSYRIFKLSVKLKMLRAGSLKQKLAFTEIG